MLRIAMLCVVAVLAVLPGVSSANNMHITHGYNYSYDHNGVLHTLFPLCWDLRDTRFLLRDYYQYFEGLNEAEALYQAEVFVGQLYDEAIEAGINTIIVRTEPRMDAQYGTRPTRTARTVNQIRTKGLRVILGGMINTGGSVTTFNSHNSRVYQIWDRVFDPLLEPCIVGYDGFDEPDNYGYQYYNDIASVFDALHATPSPVFSRPFGGMICQHASGQPLSGTPYTGTAGPEDIESLPYNFGKIMDYLRIDFYQPRSAHVHENTTMPSASGSILHRGMADLAPSNGIYRNAYTTKDEFYLIHKDSQNQLSISIFENTGGDVLDVPPSFSLLGQPISLQLSEQSGDDIRVSQSDCRSSDTGDRQGSPELNGAVVVWKHNSSITSAKAVYYHNGSVAVQPFEDALTPGTTLISKVIAVGELDCRSGWSSLSNPTYSGIAGSSEMRILWCGSTSSGSLDPWIVRIYGRNSSGQLETAPVSSGTTLTLPAGFHPDGAVWGYFWGDNPFWIYRRSAFVLFERNTGNYVTVYTGGSDGKQNELWTHGGLNQNLFGAGRVAGPVIVHRRPYPGLFPHVDYILAVVSPQNTANISSSFWVSDPNAPWVVRGAVSQKQCIPIQNSFRCEEVERLATFCVNLEGKLGLHINYDDAGMQSPWFTFPSIPEEYSILFETPPEQYLQGELIGELRSHHTRNTATDVAYFSSSTLYLRGGMFNNNRANGMFINTCTPSTYDTDIGIGAYDIYHEYAIRRTDTAANCLFANIHSQGRSVQSGSYVPSISEMAYMTIAPIVHGVRGLSFYSLDLALRSGPTVPDPSSGPRFPMEMLDWGASLDGPEELDPINVVHDFVSRFTGNHEYPGLEQYTIPDFSAALISLNATLFEDSGTFYAYNSDEMGNPIDDPALNFLALQLPNHDIIIYVSRDEGSSPTEYIRVQGDGLFGNPQGGHIVWVDAMTGRVEEGWPYVGVHPTYKARTLVRVDFTSMQVLESGVAATIIWLPASDRDHTEFLQSELVEANAIEMRISSNTGSDVSIEAVGAEVLILDLMGRCIERVPAGSTGQVSSSVHPSGMYFAVQTTSSGSLEARKIVLVN